MSKPESSSQENFHKDSHLNLFNEWKDLKFSIQLGAKASDGWRSFSCGFFRLQTMTSSFIEIYSTMSADIVAEISEQDLQDLSQYLDHALTNEGPSDEFVVGTQDFRLQITKSDDVFRVKCVIDLYTLRPERMDAGLGDCELSLVFNTSVEQITAFRDELKTKV